MKQIKNLASWTTRLFTAIVMVMGMVMFASCDKDLNTDSGLGYSSRYVENPSSPFYGEKIINDSTKRDSVIVDGEVDKIDLKFTIRAREDREVFVDDFSNPQADEYFSSDRRLLDSRKEGNWLVYTYVTNPHKGVQVSSTGETVPYETLEEVATYVPTSREFKSQGWEVENTSDVFKAAQISSKEGFTELDYTNSIKATYTGVNTSKVVNLEEKIFFFAKGNVPVPEKYEATGERTDYPTYTTVTYEKFAIYNDGHRESVAKDSENLPIRIVPETNWTINVDNLGTYVSNAFAKTLISKTPRKQGNFSYNEYCYRVYNTVAGQTNSFLIYVPNDIVREDKDAKKEYANTDLVVAKGSEATTFKSEDDSKKVYAYSVVANVIFGASQNVTLPGTINVKKATPANHEHGKVREVLFTSTMNENRSFYKSVCVIVFEDGYRSIGMAENSANAFSFNMSSYTNGVNSTVYTGGKWIPSIAVDENSDGCMVWYDENYSPKRTYDFLSANRNRWNNGHNTVVDVRRSYTIIDGGYGVTLKLNGASGQTLHF